MAVLCAGVSLLVAIAGPPSPVAATVPPRPREVVVLYSDRGPYVDATLEASLQTAPGGAHVVTENLDLSRLDDEDYARRLVGLLRRKYRDRDVDLVIPVLLPAIRFMARNGEAAFPGVPVVFCAVDAGRLKELDLPPSMAGVAGHLTGLPTIRAALELQPDTRRVVLVAGESPIDLYWRRRVREELRVLEPRLEVVVPAGLTMPEMLDFLRALVDRTIVFFLIYTEDGAGSLYSTDAIRLVVEASRVPVYAAYEPALGSGVLGGYMFSYERQARKAAEIALRVLRGTPPREIGVHELEGNAFMFDWRQLRRWNLPESRLPPGSEVRYRPPSAWDQYRREILGALAVVLLQAALVVGLLVQAGRRRRAELEAGRLRGDLAHLNRVSTLGELAASLAHELNQPLTAILSNVQAAQILLSRDSPDLEEIREILSDVASDDERAGQVIRRLRDLFTKGAGEKAPLDVNELIREVLRLLHNDVTLRGALLRADLGVGLPLVEGDRIQLQQVVLNLVVNGLDAIGDQPPGERNLTIRSSLERTKMRIDVADSGPGIPESDRERLFQPFFTTKRSGMGMGLAIARTIVEAHGGDLSVVTHPGAGALFRVTIPTTGAGAH
jgi:signal transduction histidine kinase